MSDWKSTASKVIQEPDVAPITTGSWKDSATIVTSPTKKMSRLDEIQSNPDFEVTSDLYEGTTSLEEQEAIYKYLTEQEGSQQGIFRNRINGQAIPKPTRSLATETISKIPYIGPAIASVGEGFNHYEDVAGNEIMDLSSELVAFGAALVDQVGELAGKDFGVSKSWDDKNAAHKTEGVVDTLVGEGAKLAVVTAVTRGGNALSTLGPKTKAAWDLAKIDVVYGLISDKEQEVGFSRWAQDTLGVEDLGMQKDLAEKLNVIIESLMITGVTVPALKAVSKTAKWSKDNILGGALSLMGGMKFMENHALNELLQNTLKRLPQGMDPQKAIAELAEGINKNKSEVINGTEIKNTTQQGISKTSSQKIITLDEEIAALKNDPLKASERQALIDEREFYNKTELQSINQEQSAINRGQKSMIQTSDILDDQNQLVPDSLSMGDKAYGGVKATNKFGEALEGSVDKTVDGYKQTVQEATNAVDQLKASILEGTENTDFGKVLMDLSDNTGISLKATTTNTAKQIRNVLQEVYTTMSATQSKKYNDLLDAAGDIPLDSSFKELLDASDKELFPNSGFFDDVPTTYKEAFKKYNTVLSKRISNLINSASPDLKSQNQLEQLLALKENLTLTQIDKFVNSGEASSELVGRLAKEAQDYSRDEFYSKWSSDESSSIFRKLSANFESMKVSADYPLANEGQIAAARDRSATTVETLMRDRFSEHAVVLEDLMTRGGQPELTRTYVKAAAAEKLLMELNKVGSVAELNPNKILQAFKNLTEHYPDVTKDMDQFIADFTRRHNNIEEMEKFLVETAAEAERIEQRLKGDALGGWFKRNLDDTGFTTNKTSASQTASEIFESPQAAVYLENIVEQMERTGDRVALGGLKSAYYRHVRSKFVKTDGTINIEAARNLLDGESGLITKGNILFGEDKDILNATISILENISAKKVLRVEATKGGSVALDRVSAANESVMSWVNTTVTMIYGVLNPVAARINKGTTAINKWNNPIQKYAFILDRIHADPEYFLLLLEQNSKVTGPKAKDLKRLTRQFLLKGLPQEMTNGDQTEEAMSQ